MKTPNHATMTPADWSALADSLDAASHRAFEAREESWQRSDTDGFLTQWAHGITGAMEREQSRIARAGGVAEFVGLYTVDGRRVAAKLVTFPDPQRPWTSLTKWCLEADEARRFGRKWLPIGARSRVQKTLGLCERRELAPAWARIGGSGRGLSGCASAYVEVYRAGDPLGSDAVPL